MNPLEGWSRTVRFTHDLGQECYIDAQDSHLIKDLINVISPNGYLKVKNNKFLHRVILQPSKGKETHHVNGNKLDNRRKNLIAATRAEHHKMKPTYSKYTGVSWCKWRSKWQAYIDTPGRREYLGRYTTEKKAYQARKAAERRQKNDKAG